jgi:hypothetical protein
MTAVAQGRVWGRGRDCTVTPQGKGGLGARARDEVAPPQELVTNLQLGDAMWGGARSSIGRRKAVRRHQEGGVGSRRRKDRRKGVGPRRCREEDGGGATPPLGGGRGRGPNATGTEEWGCAAAGRKGTGPRCHASERIGVGPHRHREEEGGEAAAPPGRGNGAAPPARGSSGGTPSSRGRGRGRAAVGEEADTTT